MIEKIQKFLHNREQLLEMILYLVFGVLTTAVSWTTYFVWRQAWGMSNFPVDSASYMMIANSGQVVAFVLSVAFAFATNKRFVFRSKRTMKNGLLRELGLFASARVLSWVIFDIVLFNVCLLLLKNVLSGADLWIKLAMNVLVVIFNYVASKRIVFKRIDQ